MLWFHKRATARVCPYSGDDDEAIHNSQFKFPNLSQHRCILALKRTKPNAYFPIKYFFADVYMAAGQSCRLYT